MLKRYVTGLSWFFFIFLHALNGQGQQALEFSHFSIEDGLSHSSVWAIVQDYQGFMWLGTFNGLNRFDGHSFKRYKHDSQNSKSLRGNHIQALYEDSKRKLWIGSAEGLNLYDRKTDAFEYFAYEQTGITNNQTVNSIIEGKDGTLWVGGWKGLSYLDTVKRSLVLFKPGFSPDENTKIVYDILSDSHGNLWVATEQGVDYYDFKKKLFRSFRHKLSASGNLPSNQVLSLMLDHEMLWIGTREGIYTLNNVDSVFENIIPQLKSDIINDLANDDDRSVLIATENGLYVYDKYSASLTHCTKNKKGNGLSDKVVKHIYQDNKKNLWLGTYYGVNFNGRHAKFNLLQKKEAGVHGLKNPYVLALLESEGYVLAGTAAGIEVLDVSADTAKVVTHKYPALATMPSNAITSLTADNRGNIFIATWPGRLYSYDIRKNLVKELSKPLLSPRQRVFTLLSGKDGTLWVGVENGLYSYNWQSNTWDKREIFEDHVITYLFEDSKRDLWIGSSLGLIKYTPATRQFIYFRDLEPPKRLDSKIINCVYEDADGLFWIATDQSLYLQERDGSFKSFKKQIGLANEDTKAILEDEHDNLWISTTNGLCRFGKKDFLLRTFDILDGLQGREFIKSVALKLKTGKMIFGGAKGINMFLPESIKDDLVPPNVVITDFKILNQQVPIGSAALPCHISVAKELTLDYTDMEFSFEFVALNFVSPQENQYAYKMEGFDRNWNFSGTRRFASYTNLPTDREYIFRVKASNADNVWNEHGAAVKIYIRPPFWETWWFKVLLYGSTTMLALLAFRIRSTVLRKQKIQLQKEVNIRTAELRHANERLKFQAEEIEQMNELLKKDNLKLERDVKDLSQARVLQKWVSFEEFQNIYSSDETCYKFIEGLKWEKEFHCKKCGNAKYSPGQIEFSRRCSKCNYIETITAGTIFEGVKFPITKAFYLLFLISESENYTLKELASLVDLSHKTCWSFKKRVEDRTKNKNIKKNKDGLSHLILLS